MTSPLAGRVLRYDELIPCTTAFIDARTPGSDQKQNYCLIGNGVAENPGQVVHIKLPHPFDIGAAKQPRGCKNSHHSHDTSETFVVHKGEWKFTWGHDGSDGEAVLKEGDTISIPTHVFRGFENVGADDGFLFCILGLNEQQSAGHVTWAPYVFDNAKEHGLVLLDDGRLIDTVEGMEVPEDGVEQQPTTMEDVKNYQVLSLEDMLKCVVLNDDVDAQPKGGLTAEGVAEYAILGPASNDENIAAGKMGWEHGGYASRRLKLEAGASVPSHKRTEHEVIFVHAGKLALTVDGEETILNEGDMVTIPEGALRTFASDVATDLIVVRGASAPAAAQF